MTDSESTETDRNRADAALAIAFSPHQPINQSRFFRGRRGQVREIVDTVATAGLHAVIYGERGVGKTSLASTIRDFFQDVVGVSRTVCSGSDTFSSVIRRALGEIQLTLERPTLGLTPGVKSDIVSPLDMLPAEGALAADAVAAQLARIPMHIVLVIDEFDRLPRSQANSFADFIKSMSDRGAVPTVVLVGVAEDVDNLMVNHQSIERCLRQVQLQRMAEGELAEIMEKGFGMAGFTLASDAPKDRIISISQGFPHYTHLLALYAARNALDEGRRTVTSHDVARGVQVAVERTDQRHRELYHRATTGTRSRNLWKEVVTACALATSDERGYFSGRAIQERATEITGMPVIQQTLAYHLGKLTEPERGPLLERTGQERRYRYRFLNPLMRPFIIMKAMDDGLLPGPGETAALNLPTPLSQG